MSLVLHIEELIDTLFEHPVFQSKLKTFCESESSDFGATKQWKSVRTDFSDRLEDSQSKCNLQVDAVTAEIQELLSEVYNKSSHQKLEAIEMCRIYEDIEMIKEEIQKVKARCDQLKDQVQQMALQRKQKQKRFVSHEEFKGWESEVLEKVDIVNKRNFKKVESIFADKLNSFQMNIQKKVDLVKEEAEERKEKRIVGSPANIQQPQESGKKTKAKDEEAQAQLMKKLKSAKSLGSLFGFKS